NGQSFSIYKLRSMYQDAEKNGHKWASKNDTRITKVGRFIRKTRIDELPQIINVIKGEMSIIGPRPERPEFINEFLKDIPNFNERLAVRPGITGWAQVNGGYELTPK
ncbi:sugar transferase, partial [Streptococcus pneumoniae]|nr:sugar transferase [Streptococcus pneumoniae]